MSKGVMYMLISCVMFSIMQGMVKYLHDFSLFQLIFFRAIFSFVICLFLLIKSGERRFGNNKPLLISRGVFGVFSLITFFYSLQHVPLGVSLTIVNIMPLILTLIAYFYFKEKIRWYQWFLLLLAFCGILLIKKWDNRLDSIGLWATVASAIFASLSHATVRKSKDYDSSTMIVFYFAITILPVSIPFMILQWQQPSFGEWFLLIGIGITSHLGQLFLTKAYLNEEISKVTTVYYSGIIFAFCIGYFIFDEVYSLQALWGIGVIILSILINVILNYFSAKSKSLL